jgi:hypothetical protein
VRTLSHMATRARKLRTTTLGRPTIDTVPAYCRNCDRHLGYYFPSSGLLHDAADGRRGPGVYTEFYEGPPPVWKIRVKCTCGPNGRDQPYRIENWPRPSDGSTIRI